MDIKSKRLLLSLTSVTENEDEFSENFSVEQLFASIVGVLCLAYVVFMCSCKDRTQKEKAQDKQLQHVYIQTDKNNVTQNRAQKHSQIIENVVSGGITLSSGTLPGNVTPSGQSQSTRVLPAPPMSQNLLSDNKTKYDDDDYDYAYPEQHKDNNKNVVTSSDIHKRKDLNTLSHVYDHLGFKPDAKPSDYDDFPGLKKSYKGKLTSGISRDSEDDYSEVEDPTCPVVIDMIPMTCPVIIDVKPKRKETSNPYANVRDSHSKEEDPYNLIGESDGMVASSFITQLKQSGELDDPYTTVQDESAGDVGRFVKTEGSIEGQALLNPTPVLNHLTIAPSTLKNEGAVMDEYAVVQKGQKLIKHAIKKTGNGCMHPAEEDDYSVAPPELPRPPSVFQIVENPTTFVLSDKNTNHKYSRVTARESLASISAKKSSNPYDIVGDISDDAVAMAEGLSRDSSEIPVVKGDNERRQNQISDTYTEIGICERL